MTRKRKVKYYVHFEALDGFDETLDEQFEEDEGILIDIVHSSIAGNDGPIPISEVLIEDIKTHEIKHIDSHQLIKFVEE